MKTTLFFVLISITAFSQSKKELRAEIDQLKSEQAQLNLAHQIQLEQLTKKVDSLNRVITRQTNQSQLDHSTIVRLRQELDTSIDSLNRVKSLLTTNQPKKKEGKTNVTAPQKSEIEKPELNPFAYGGDGNGAEMSYGSNHSGSGTCTGGNTRCDKV